MINRTAGFLLILLLSGCSLLPTQAVEPTICPSGVCQTATQKPTTIVVTPTALLPQTPVTDVPTETGTTAPTETPADATFTPEIYESETPFLPTGMVELTSTPPIYVSPTSGPSPTKTPIVSDKIYILQEGTPRLIQNFTNSNSGCQWMGAAGQVFGVGGVPMKNMVVVITGELDGELIDAVGLTGLASAYGTGGYEIQIANHTATSTQSLFVQLFDINGMVLSDPYPIDTSADCTMNLVIINFIPNS
ncbi:MAG: hypothetical protein AB9891_14985 [Anaerolineaceae bacterium]